MRTKKKLIVSMLVVAFVLLSIIATVAIAFALTQQTIKTTLNIGYTVEDIDGTASATFTIGGVTENLTAMKGTQVIGDKLVFKAGDTENAGNLMFPEDALALTAQDSEVVIQYTYSNTGSKHYIASMDFNANIEADNMKVEYSIDGTTYSEDRYAVVVPANTSNRSYWIKISIADKAKSASFTGDFDWLLSSCDPQSDSYLSMPSLEFEGNDGEYSVSVVKEGEYLGNLVFPSEVNGAPVTTIVSSKYINEYWDEVYPNNINEKVTSVYIPSSVTTIGEFAFQDFNNLKTVNFEQNESAGASVSAQNTNGLNKIEMYAFDHCTNLKEFIIPDTVTNLGWSAFYYCSALTEIIIPNSVTTLGCFTFEGCTGLRNVTIGAGVSMCLSRIDAFYNCPGIRNITVDPGNETYYSIGNCMIHKSTKSLALGGYNSIIPTDDSVITCIGSAAFADVVGLKNITIPNNITTIEHTAFYGCNGLTGVTIGSGVTSIGEDAFTGCTNLKNITTHTLSDSVVTAIKSIANTNGEMNLTIETVTSIGASAFNNCLGLTSVTIGSSVEYIMPYAFGSTGITSITIPENVTSVTNYSFYGCNELTTIIVDSDNTKYHSAGNCIIETASKTLIRGCKTSVIPTDGTVTSIGEESFVGCTTLTEIVIPGIITTIGSGAFNGCAGLTNITFENKTGWTAFDKYNMNGGRTEEIKEADLTDPANAAALLKNESENLWDQWTRIESAN